MRDAEIVIGGDVFPNNRNLRPFLEGDAAALFTDLLPEIQQADLSVVNLECPLIERESPIWKSGPVLGAPPRAVQALGNAGFSVACLSNNHIMDHGSQGLRSTIAACRGAGLSVVGAGENLREAGEMLIKEVRGVRLGILAYAEREFSAAASTRPGANPLNLAGFVREMRRQRGSYDRLVVLLHGGTEHFPYPSPALQDTCRFMVEEGADAVICQHSHCPGGYERYEDGYIVYGQGNLLFDRYPKRGEAFYQGYLVRLRIGAGGTKMRLVPYRQSDAVPGARRMVGSEAERFKEQLRSYSEVLQAPASVSDRWGEMCREKRGTCFSTLLGHGRLRRFINSKLHFAHLFYSRKNLLALQNLIRCESHREALETLLDDMLKLERRR